jgi:CRISPR system Cascade subunit CasE
LFRREQHGQWPVFYVLSQHPPHNNSLAWDVGKPKTFEPQLKNGQHLAFSLRVNPVVTLKHSDDDSDKKRIRHDAVAHFKQLHYQEKIERPSQARIIQRAGEEWLDKRADDYGFALDNVCVDNYRQQRFYKSPKKPPITLSTLDFDGILEVTNADKFLSQFFYGGKHESCRKNHSEIKPGIGPGRAFGCGLMLIRRV